MEGSEHFQLATTHDAGLGPAVGRGAWPLVDKLNCSCKVAGFFPSASRQTRYGYI